MVIIPFGEFFSFYNYYFFFFSVLLPDDFSTKSTFFEIILFCEDQPLPWRCLCAAAYRCSYPELAVIAQGYENSQSLTCLSTWLVVSSTPQVLTIFTEKFSPLESKIWSLESVLDLMEILIQKDLRHLLLRGIKMMQPAVCVMGRKFVSAIFC